MIWSLGLRVAPARINFPQCRTHVSRAAKKVVEKQHASVHPEEATRIRRSKIAQSLFPKFMQGYASKIANAPVSHIASFLIVHELSAIVPLFGIWGAFYYFDYIPLGVIPETYIEKGSAFIRKMAERNDWKQLAYAESGSRIILQGAASYFMVKALLPLRLVFSLWAMPWFARICVIPIGSRVAALTGKLFKRKQ